jgi:hypothetical protein
MKTKALLSPRGLVSAAVLGVGGVALAWACVRTAAVEALSGDAPALLGLAPHDPDVVLDVAADALVTRHGILPPTMLAQVRRAALAAPLDARAFLILGHQQWLDGHPGAAVKTFEAGQKLDPRLRLIHLLLLDRYLRTGRYADAAGQFSLLARLAGRAQGPIVKAMAAMSLDPKTRDAVRATLRSDPSLERGVLSAMASGDIPPSTIFALASPTAQADATSPASWGLILVNRLVQQHRYTMARNVWQHIYRLSDAQTADPLFNARFAEGRSAPPFDWSLTADSLGAADIRDGSLAIDYYGRDSGNLVSQLLVLKPGRYRFAFTVDPGKTDNAAKLFWSLTCTTGGTPSLMNHAITAGATKRRIAADLVVPAGCPAQMLTLRGEAGEFPAPISLTVRDLDLRPVAGARP